MTLRKPLVVGGDGLPQQLQSGDSLDAATTTSQTRSITNGESSSAVVRCAPVYTSAADTVKRGQANAKSTSQIAGLGFDASIAAAATGFIIGSGIMVATTAEWDAVAGTTGGLTFATLYFLDPANPGKLTATSPTTSGQCVTLVGRAISSTEMLLLLRDPILL